MCLNMRCRHYVLAHAGCDSFGCQWLPVKSGATSITIYSTCIIHSYHHKENASVRSLHTLGMHWLLHKRSCQQLLYNHALLPSRHPLHQLLMPGRQSRSWPVLLELRLPAAAVPVAPAGPAAHAVMHLLRMAPIL